MAANTEQFEDFVEAGPLVVILLRERDRLGVSDSRFARETLQVSSSFWSLVRSGQRTPGTKLIINAFRAFPHTHGTEEPTGACTACEMAIALAEPAPLPLPRPAFYRQRLAAAI